MQRNAIEIILRLRDQVTRELKAAQSALKGMRGELERAKKAARSMSRELESLGGSLPALIGSGGLLYGLKAAADAAFQAEAQMRIFANTVRAMGGDTDRATAEIERLAKQLGLIPAQLAGPAAMMLRAGYNMQQVVKAFEAGAASALAAGKTAASGIENVAMALSTGQSIYLNYIGIAENIGPVLQKVASSMKGASEEAVRAAQNQAALNVVLKATAQEVQSLPTLLGGYAGESNRLARNLYELKVQIGKAVLPTLTELTGKLADLAELARKMPPWLKALATGAGAAASAVALLGGALAVLRTTLAVLSGPAGLVLLAASALGGLAATAAVARQKVNPAAEAIARLRTQVSGLRTASDVDDLLRKMKALGETLKGPAKEAWTEYIAEAEKSKQSIEDISKAAQEAIAKFLAVQQVAIEAEVKAAREAFERQITSGFGKKAFEHFPKWIRDGLEQATKEGGQSLARMVDGAIRYLRQQMAHAGSSFEAAQYESQIAHLERLRPLAQKWASAQAKANAILNEQKRILDALNTKLKHAGDNSKGAAGGIKSTGNAAKEAAAYLDQYAAAIARLNREMRQLRADDARGRITMTRAQLAEMLRQMREERRALENARRQSEQEALGMQPPHFLSYGGRGARRGGGGVLAEQRRRYRELLADASKLTAAERDRRQALAEIAAEQERLNELAKEHLEYQQAMLRAREMEIARTARLVREASKLTQAELDRRRAAREVAGMPDAFQQQLAMYQQYQQLRLRSERAAYALERRELSEASKLTDAERDRRNVAKELQEWFKKQREELKKQVQAAEQFVDTLSSVYSGVDRIFRSFGEVGKNTGQAIRDLWSGFSDVAKSIPVIGGLLSKVFDFFGKLEQGLYQLSWQATIESLKKAQQAYQKLGDQMVLINQRAFASVKKYQEHFLFGLISVDRYKVEIDKFAMSIAQTLEQGVLGGLRNAMKAFLEGAQDWQDQLKEGLRSAIENAVIEAVIQGAIFKGALGEMLTNLTQALAKGNYDAAREYVRQIAAAVPDLTQKIAGVLEPFRQAMAGLRSGDRERANNAAPGIQTIRYELPSAPVLAAPAWVDRMGEHVDRFGKAVDRFAKARISVDVSVADSLAWSVRGVA